MLADTFIKTVRSKIGALSERSGDIRTAAEMIVNAVLNGKHVFVADSNGILNNELTDRDSGLALFQLYLPERTELAEGDVLIISAITSDDQTVLHYCETARSVSAKIIAIAPTGNLTENADAAICNDSDVENGTIDLSGVGKPFCPVSGITNAALGWMLTADTAELLIAQDKIPSVLWGDHLKNGAEKRVEARRRHTSLGY